MREDFLHYLWRMARFDLRQLTTTAGEAIQIIDFGQLNRDAGPDFSGAQLRIGGVHWVGNVEMHLHSRQWYEHGHDKDPAYENVILHVVLKEERIVYRANGERIPCLELAGRIPAGLLKTYLNLWHSEAWIPCEQQFHRVAEAPRSVWLERLLLERLSRRADELEDRLERTQRDWEELFYQSLARSLGGKVNAGAMEMLARSLPLRVLLRHKHSQLQLEALLFGQAGLLPTKGREDYPLRLRREYQLLATKYELQPLPKMIWRYLRLRPANFPDLRIAQLARLLAISGQLFSKSLAAAGRVELENMYSVQLSNYWRAHYRFGVPGKRLPKRMGRGTIHSILINAVAPLFYLYGRQRGNHAQQQRALTLLAELPAENNLVIRRWRDCGQYVGDAARSQALLELKKYYCDQRRCLSCAIGAALLAREKDDDPLTVQEVAALYARARARPLVLPPHTEVPISRAAGVSHAY